MQVGSIGLLGAIERFDPARGTEFTAFAVPTIAGEIKRHVRDRTDTVRLPRRLQAAGARLPAVRQELTSRLGRAPTVRELARGLELEPSELASLVRARREVYEAEGVADSSAQDPGERVLLLGAFAALDEEERRLIYLRHLKGMSAAEVAKEVGLSERQLSRRMASALAKLRGEVEGLAPVEGQPDQPARNQERRAAPKSAEHSGRLLLRMPNSLHDELARVAGREHVSLNQFITNTLAAAIGWGQHEEDAQPAAETAPRRASPWLRAAVVTNLVIVVVAGVLAVVLLVIAWQNGL